jgi:hypothetical protein
MLTRAPRPPLPGSFMGDVMAESESATWRRLFGPLRYDVVGWAGCCFPACLHGCFCPGFAPAPAASWPCLSYSVLPPTRLLHVQVGAKMLAANRSYRFRLSYLPAGTDQIAAAGKVGGREAAWKGCGCSTLVTSSGFK